MTSSVRVIPMIGQGRWSSGEMTSSVMVIPMIGQGRWSSGEMTSSVMVIHDRSGGAVER